jgi:hypothetical protein
LMLETTTTPSPTLPHKGGGSTPSLPLGLIQSHRITLQTTIPIQLNWNRGLAFCLGMIFSENRVPLFGIMP